MINWDLILAVSGILIALAASIATIWQGVLTRKHNKLSVKPVLRVDRIIATGKDVRITLVNSGVGPAIINSIELKVDSKLVSQDSSKSWDIALSKVVPQKYNVRLYIPFKNETFSAGESHNLYEIPASELVNEDYPILLDAFQRITFIISYSSVYEETFIKYL